MLKILNPNIAKPSGFLHRIRQFFCIIAGYLNFDSMKQFFKITLASMLGFFLSFVLLLVFFIFMVVAAVSSLETKKSTTTATNSILQISLNYKIEERTSSNPFSNFDFKTFNANPDLGLNDILACIKRAKTDANIKGIFLNLSTIHTGIASIEEIRNALINFRQSKKFIIAYSETYTQAAYYLSSVADKIYLNPVGDLEFKGLRAELLFFKGALEKLELEPEIIRHGKFKSAVEPFLLDKMSPENRKQTGAFMGSIWNHLLENIATSRSIPVADLHTIANNLSIQTAADAEAFKLVDSLLYYDEVLSILQKRIGAAAVDKINFVHLPKYTEAQPEPALTKMAPDKIAVIYAVGTIVDGKGERDNIGSEPIAATIRRARLDNAVKGIVFRVNSPGGSALASEIIWREIYLARKVKPVVVSMGDYAASGGYYIACAADEIIAEPTTITGSIGVFGVLFNGKNFLKNILGISVDTVKTGRFADIGSFTRPLTAAERAIIQKRVDKVYATFLNRVADGRKRTVAEIDSMAQGRVWSGVDALRLGLVDRLGTIDSAINTVARLAGIKQYKIMALPEQKDPFSKILAELAGETEKAIIRHQLGTSYKYWERINTMKEMNGIQTRIPFEAEIY
jgi:protease-4